MAEAAGSFRVFAPTATRVVVAVWLVLLLVLRAWNAQMYAESANRLIAVTQQEEAALFREAADFEVTWERDTAALEAELVELAAVAASAIKRYREEMAAMGAAPPDLRAVEQLASGGGTRRHTLVHSAREGSSGAPDLMGEIAGVDDNAALERKVSMLIKNALTAQVRTSKEEGAFLGRGQGVDSEHREMVAVAREVEHQVLQAFLVLYRTAQLQDRITRYRETFQPFIAAVERRKDRMLYNYI